MSAANSPLERITLQEGELSGFNKWIYSYRCEQGLNIHYPKHSELLLKDGSTVLCLVPSTFSVDYSSGKRNFELAEGKIEITAAYDPTFPMVVSVGDAEIRVTGTRFIVSTDLYETE